MYLRVAAKTVAMAAIPITATVYAADTMDTGKDQSQDTAAVQVIAVDKIQKTAADEDNKVFRHQLPIYGEPVPVQFSYIPEKPGVIQEGIVPVREVLLATINRCDKFIKFASETKAVCTTNINDFLRYLRDDSGAIPRAVFITVSGLGGIVAAYKGGMFRKTIYASVGMAGSVAVCYPQMSIDMSKRGWILTKDQAKELWNQTRNTENKAAVKGDSIAEKVEEKFGENLDKMVKDTVKRVDETNSSTDIAQKVDHGMSKSEDKDMYSTRTS